MRALYILLCCLIFKIEHIIASTIYDEMESIGVLTNGTTSSAKKVNNSGMIVGSSKVSNKETAFFYNDESKTITNLGYLGAGNTSYASDISDDGTVITGYSNISNNSSVYNGFIYKNNSMENIGTLSGANMSKGYGISGDGETVIGFSNDEDYYPFAIKYESETITSLGTLPIGVYDEEPYSYAYGISQDGSTIVGYSGCSGGCIEAFKYKDGTMTGLGSLLDPVGTNKMSYAYSASSDGSIIVGKSDSSEGVRAFKYDDDNGMINLGVLDGGSTSQALDVSADGSIIVGESDSTDGLRAFKYDEENGMTSLGVLSGGSYSKAEGISPDGSIIVGTSDSTDGERAFIYRISTESLINSQNNLTTITNTQSEFDRYINLKSATLSRLISIGNPEKLKSNKKLNLGINLGMDRTSDLKYKYSNISILYNINKNLQIGALIEQDLTDDYQLNIKNTSSTPAIALYSNYFHNKKRNGLGISIAGAFAKEKVSIRRNSNTSLTDTEVGYGNSKIYNFAIMAKLSYGIKFQQHMIKPYIQIKNTNIKRSGYTENSDISFPITFDSVSNRFTSSALGLDINYNISVRSNIVLNAGIENNTYSQQDDYTASMDYYGTISNLSAESYNSKNNTIFTGVKFFYMLNRENIISANYMFRQDKFGDNSEDVHSVYIGYSLNI